MTLPTSALKQLKYVTGKIPKLVGAAVWGLQFHTSFSTYMTSRASYQENPQSQSSSRLPPLVSCITDQVPHLVLPSVNDEATGQIVYRFFNPINKQVFGIRKQRSSILPNTARHFWSSNGLLAFADFNECGLYVWAPPFSSFSDLSEDVIKLPSMESLPSVVGVTRNMDGSVEKYRLQLRGSHSLTFRDITQEVSHCLVRQVAFSSFPSSASTISNSNCAIMAIYGGDTSSHLAFCKLGDATWVDVPAPYSRYVSITYCSKDQLFYAISDSETVEAWDVHDRSSTKRISVDRYMDYPMPKYKGREATLGKQREAILGMRRDKKLYLVESSGDLLLVVRHFFRNTCINPPYNHDSYFTAGFDVYKFDLASPTNWTHVEHLQDRALFVGQTNPFSLSTRDFPGLMGNSIYFADDELNLTHKPFSCHRSERTSHDVGVFNLEDNRMEFYYPFMEFYYPFGIDGLKGIDDPPAVWIAPNMCGY